MENTETKTVLVLGASGKSGGHAARAFESAGWVVRRFDRQKDDLEEVATGADVIFNGLNPPNYEGWETAIPDITRRVIAAAESSGATVIVPGNVYVFSKDGGAWNEETPHRPETRKGAIRAEMEVAYRDAAERGVQTILLRAGDFFGDTASENWLDLMVLKDLAAGRFTYPGRMDAKHSWAYLPDFARAAVELAERRGSLAAFEDVAFSGFTLTGAELQALVEGTTGPLRLKSVPWFAMRVASPFWRLGRELLEMRYLWDVEHWLDGAKFRTQLPEFGRTPVDDAFASIIDELAPPSERALAASPGRG
ncbi:MAG: nucleoside-diphosphate-sugar epimerase [Polyangiales bacterium]|jgi:nucleoside-diphosphate-sugar epimerase